MTRAFHQMGSNLKAIWFSSEKITHGAKLYFDSMNNCAVKIEDIETPFELDVMVNFQGDQYMGKNGAKYLLTPHFEEMDSKDGYSMPERTLNHQKQSQAPMQNVERRAKVGNHPHHQCQNQR